MLGLWKEENGQTRGQPFERGWQRTSNFADIPGRRNEVAPSSLR